MKPLELFERPTIRMTPSIADGIPYKDPYGLIQFRAGLWVGGKEKEKLTVVSGQAYNQVLLTCRQRMAGSGAPIGEGCYRLGDPDATRRVNWASGRVGNYGGSFKAGLGPVWVGIHSTPEYPSSSFDLGAHADWNADEGFPGTIGCMGIPTPGHDLTGLKEFVGWFAENDVADLVVDHYLGTVPRPALAAPAEAHGPPPLRRAKLYSKPGRTVAFLDGAGVKELTAHLDFYGGNLGLKLNALQLDESKIESLTLEVAWKGGK